MYSTRFEVNLQGLARTRKPCTQTPRDPCSPKAWLKIRDPDSIAYPDLFST
jgi:hypothetical protein